MTDLIGLYDYAEQRAVGVYWFTMDHAESLSFMDSDGDCYIAMEPWQLAEYFDVTEELIRKAICWYKHGNMAVDQYQ